MTTQAQKQAIIEAVHYALDVIGVSGLKRTPLFLSNNRQEAKEAA